MIHLFARRGGPNHSLVLYNTRKRHTANIVKMEHVNMDERGPRLCFDILERIAIMAESFTLGALICSTRVPKVIARRRFACARHKLEGLFLTIEMPYNMEHYGTGVTLGYGSPVCYMVRRIIMGVRGDTVVPVVDLYKRNAYGEYEQMIDSENTTLWQFTQLY